MWFARSTTIVSVMSLSVVGLADCYRAYNYRKQAYDPPQTTLYHRLFPLPLQSERKVAAIGRKTVRQNQKCFLGLQLLQHRFLGGHRLT